MANVIATGGVPGRPAIPGLGQGFRDLQSSILAERERERLEEEKLQREQFNAALVSSIQGGEPLPGALQGPQAPAASLQDAFMQAFQVAGDPGMDPAQLTTILQPQTQLIGTGQQLIRPDTGEVLAEGPKAPVQLSNFGRIALDLGYQKGTPEFQQAVRSMAFAETKSTSETMQMLARLPEAERARVLKGILLTKAGLAPHQATEIEQLAKAKGLVVGTPEYTKFIDEQLAAKRQDSEFQTLLEGLNEEERAAFLTEMREKRSHITAGALPTKALVDASGSVKSATTNAIRSMVLQTLFESIFDANGNLRLLDPTQGPQAQAIMTEAERLIATGQEKGISSAVSAAARSHGIDIPGGPLPTSSAALPAGATGTGSKADPFVGAPPEFLHAHPKPVYFLDKSGEPRILR